VPDVVIAGSLQRPATLQVDTGRFQVAPEIKAQSVAVAALLSLQGVTQVPLGKPGADTPRSTPPTVCVSQAVLAPAADCAPPRKRGSVQ
jgi:hypothetical protein